MSWEFVHLPLRVKTLHELVNDLTNCLNKILVQFLKTNFYVYQRLLYQEMARCEPMLGVDPNIKVSAKFPSLIVERTVLGEKGLWYFLVIYFMMSVFFNYYGYFFSIKMQPCTNYPRVFETRRPKIPEGSSLGSSNGY